MRLWVYVIRRLLFLIPTLIGLTFIVFILTHVSGTNVILSGYMNPKLTGLAKQLLIQKLTSEFHLNQPIYVQYFYWLYQILRGNWGFTNTPIFSGQVSTAIALFLPNTLMISVVASILIWVIGVPLGVYSAVNRDSAADHTVRVGSFTLYAMPIYLIGVVLILLPRRLPKSTSVLRRRKPSLSFSSTMGCQRNLIPHAYNYHRRDHT